MIFTPAQNTSNLLLHCSKKLSRIAIIILHLQQKFSSSFAGRRQSADYADNADFFRGQLCDTLSEKRFSAAPCHQTVPAR